MKIFYDESGDFSLDKVPNISVVGSLICTEGFYEDLCYFMNSFEKKIAGSSIEIKGSSLTLEQRTKVCKFINKNSSEITLTILMVDSRVTSIEDLHVYRKEQVDTFESNKNHYISRGGKAPKILEHFERLKKIADYNTRLSDQEYLQSILTTQNIRKTLQHTLVYYIDYKYAKYFKDYFFIFDRKLSTKLSPMEKYIDTYLLPFLQGNPEKQQALAIVDIWKKGHPFVDNYLNKDGDIMLNAIFKNGLRFVDSKEEPGIRLIDIVCNTLYSYLHFPENREYLNCYTLIKTAIGHQGDKYIDLVMLNPKNSIPNDYPVYGKVL